jgi:hypothetical protein
MSRHVREGIGLSAILIFVALFLLFVKPASSCDSTPKYVSGNLSTDLKGEPDTRPLTWGRAGVSYHEIAFNPAIGCSIRILRIQGDTVGWAFPGALIDGNAGVLSAFTTVRDPLGAPALCTLCSADVLTYTQTHVGWKGFTRKFRSRFGKEGYLLPRNSIWLKQAVWLNTFEVPVHIETTYNIVFKQVKDKPAPN